MSKNIGKIIRANSLPEKGKRITNVIYQVAVPGTATYIDYAVDENGDIKTPTLNQSIAKNQFGKVKTVDHKEPDNNGNVDLGIEELKNNSEASMKKIGLQEVSNSFSLSSNLGNSSEDKSVANFTFSEEEQNINLSVVDKLTALGGKLSVSKDGMSIEAPLPTEGNPTVGIIEIDNSYDRIRMQRVDDDGVGFGFIIEENGIIITSDEGNIAEVKYDGIYQNDSKLVSESDLTGGIWLEADFDLNQEMRLKKRTLIKYKFYFGSRLQLILPNTTNSTFGQEVIVFNFDPNSESIIVKGFTDYFVGPEVCSTFIFDGEYWIRSAEANIV